jgi:hypothetical protein
MRRTALVCSLTVLALALTLARSTEPSARAVTAFPRIAAVGDFHIRPEIFARGQSKAFGFLDLRLRPAGWNYRWISADGQPAFTDQGSGSCH